MKYKIIACLDTRINAFMPPQAVADMLDEDIVESNRRAVLNGSIPEDKAKVLIVYRFGTFDDVNGVLEGYQPVKLCNLADFVPRKQTVVKEETTDGDQVN